MDKAATSLLEKLLTAGDKSDAGLRSREAALTSSHLKAYHSARDLRQKEIFDSTMKSAKSVGAINIVWNKKGGEDMIERVTLADGIKLATFLNKVPIGQKLSYARERFTPLMVEHPVLDDVLKRWGLLKNVRGLGPDSIEDWLDAAKTISLAASNIGEGIVSMPIREASAKWFSDSKRVEKLTSALDVLLFGSIEPEEREPADIWAEIGLFREEQPTLISGNVTIERERVTALLDTPYSGIPAAAIKKVIGTPEHVITIENKTTFHSEARRLCQQNILLIYTAGMPTPAWMAMYSRLLSNLPSSIPIYHWGDIDEGGFRIAATLARGAKEAGHIIRPWRMYPDDIPVGARKKATDGKLQRIQRFATIAGWESLGNAIVSAGYMAEQEALD